MIDPNHFNLPECFESRLKTVSRMMKRTKRKSLAGKRRRCGERPAKRIGPVISLVLSDYSLL